MNDLNRTLFHNILDNIQCLKTTQCFSRNVTDFLLNTAHNASSTVEQVLPAILATIANTTQDAIVNRRQVAIPILYFFQSGEGSSGKSRAIDTILHALTSVELFQETDPQNVSYIRPPTVEATLAKLTRSPYLIASIESLEQKRFESRIVENHIVSFEVATYISLWSGPISFYHYNHGNRASLNNPRLQIVCELDSVSIIKMLIKSRSFYGDSLSSRILVSHPVINQHIEKLDTTKTVPTLEQVLSFNKELHYHQRVYSFDQKSESILDRTQLSFDSINQRLNNYDGFLSSILAKSLEITVRLALVLKALQVSVNSLKDFTCQSHLSERFLNDIKQLTAQPDDNLFHIDSTITKQALELTNYFNLNKVILAGYYINRNENFIQVVERICHEYEVHKPLKGSCLSWTNYQILIARRIMLADNKIITIQQITNNNDGCEVTVEVFRLLSGLGLGRVITPDDIPRAFERIDYATLAYSPTLHNQVESIGLTVHAVLEAFLRAN